MSSLHKALERLLEAWLILLILTLTAIVVFAVIFRISGASFSWYDEVASIMLAWITYYGAALAALKRSHIGFDGLLLTFPLQVRYALAIVAEIVVFAFFILLGWSGVVVLQVLTGMGLTSLPWVPIALTQSVIPISAVLFILCEALSLPEYFRRIREGVSSEDIEIQHALEGAEGASRP